MEDHDNPSVNQYGHQGAFCTLDLPRDHPAVLNYDEPPEGQPGLWCYWTVTSKDLYWSNSPEDEFHFIEWLEYLVKHFFAPWGIKLNGAIQWQSDPQDRGVLSMRDNHLYIHHEDADA